MLRLVPIVGLAIAAGLYLSAAPNPSERPAPRRLGPVGEMSAGLRAAFVHARQLEAGPAYDFATAGDPQATLQAANPEMGMVAQARAGGIWLQPSGTAQGTSGGTRGGTGSFGLQLVSQGCDERPSAAAKVAPQARGNRIEYPRDGVTEWYLNGPLGLEQGFTVTRDLGCRRKLVFEMALDRSISAELQQQGTVLALNADGRRYRYGELYSYDADGRELPSAMQLAGQRLRVRQQRPVHAEFAEHDHLHPRIQVHDEIDAVAHRFEVAADGDVHLHAGNAEGSHRGSPLRDGESDEVLPPCATEY